MTTELSIKNTDSFSQAIVSLENTQSLCEKLMSHKHYAKMGPEGIYAIVNRAKSLGIDPLDALSGALYVVQGRVGMSSEMMASLIRQAGHSIIKDSKSDNSICILHGKRKDNGDTWTCTFSMDDAKRAGLAKNMYEKYPAIMLYNRCMSMLARQLFPDVIKGCGYTIDELKEIAKVEDYKPKAEIQSIEVQPAAYEVKPKPEVKKPTVEELVQLSEILDECDPEFVKEKKEAMKKAFGTDDLKEMNVATYIRLLELAKKNKAEYFAKQMEGEDETQDDASP